MRLLAFLATLLLVSPATAQSLDGSANVRREDYAKPRRVEPLGSAAYLGSTTTFLSCDDAPDGDGPHELAFLPNGTAVVIAHKDSDALSFFDVNTRTVTHTVPVGDLPVQVAVTPNGQYALAPCVLADAVAVVDVATHTLAAMIPVTGAQPSKVLVSPDSHWAVVGCIDDAVNSHFSILDLTTLTEVATIPSASQGVIGFWFSPESGDFGYFFTAFDFSSDGTTIVYPDRANSRVLLYDRATASQVGNLATAANPSGVDISNDGLLAVVSHEFGVNTLSRINLLTHVVTASFVGSN